jgi:hypothetical protein
MQLPLSLSPSVAAKQDVPTRNQPVYQTCCPTTIAIEAKLFASSCTLHPAGADQARRERTSADGFSLDDEPRPSVDLTPELRRASRALGNDLVKAPNRRLGFWLSSHQSCIHAQLKDLHNGQTQSPAWGRDMRQLEYAPRRVSLVRSHCELCLYGVWSRIQSINGQRSEKRIRGRTGSRECARHHSLRSAAASAVVLPPVDAGVWAACPRLTASVRHECRTPTPCMRHTCRNCRLRSTCLVEAKDPNRYVEAYA